MGCIVSVFERFFHFDVWMAALGLSGRAVEAIGLAFTVLFGLFAGMFVGCLALAIAEMLDSIPIFARRVGFRHGLGIAICAMAAGKFVGSLLYFILGVHDWV